MHIIIKKRILLYKGFKIKCSVGKSGLSKLKKEGDLKTPVGVFKLGLLYYRKDRNRSLKCNIKKREIKKNMGWCDDSDSKKYNRQIYLPYKFRTENLFRKDKIYDIFINIKYNYIPTIRHKGSAIFFHLCSKEYKPTKGCIAIQKKDFLKILPLIDSKTKINIK